MSGLRALIIFAQAFALWLVVFTGSAAANDPLACVKAIFHGSATDRAKVKVFPTEKPNIVVPDQHQVEELKTKAVLGEPHITFRSETWLSIALPLRFRDAGELEQDLYFLFHKENAADDDWKLLNAGRLDRLSFQATFFKAAREAGKPENAEAVREHLPWLDKYHIAPAELVRRMQNALGGEQVYVADFKESRADYEALVRMFRELDTPMIILRRPDAIKRGDLDPPKADDPKLQELLDLAESLGFNAINRAGDGTILEIGLRSPIMPFREFYFAGHASKEEQKATLDFWAMRHDFSGITDLGGGWLLVRFN